MVQVNLYAAARAAIGSNSINVEITNLHELIEVLCGLEPKMESILKSSKFLVDGTPLHDLTASINNAREIDVLPQFAGGSSPF